jgi:hypothetical protein
MVRGDGAERMVGFERTIVDYRQPKAIGRIVSIDPDELVRILIRQRIDDHCPDDGEHRGSGAKADADRDDDG